MLDSPASDITDYVKGFNTDDILNVDSFPSLTDTPTEDTSSPSPQPTKPEPQGTVQDFPEEQQASQKAEEQSTPQTVEEAVEEIVDTSYQIHEWEEEIPTDPDEKEPSKEVEGVIQGF